MLRGIWGDPERYRKTYWSKFAEQGFYFAGNGTTPSATHPLAATAQIPLTELHHSGKIIVLVRKGAFNYPTTSDCSEQSLGLTCSHDQTWTGTLTMTRG